MFITTAQWEQAGNGTTLDGLDGRDGHPLRRRPPERPRAPISTEGPLAR
jgi:hypothetical protein